MQPPSTPAGLLALFFTFSAIASGCLAAPEPIDVGTVLAVGPSSVGADDEASAADRVREIGILIAGLALAVTGVLAAIRIFAQRGMTTWTVGRRLQFGFGTMLLVLTGLALESYLSLHHALADFRRFQQRANTNAETVALLTEFFEADLATKELALTRDPADWSNYQQHQLALEARLHEAEAAYPAPELQAHLRAIAQEISTFHAGANDLLAAIKDQNDDRIQAAIASLGKFTDVLKHDVEDFERILLDQQNQLGATLAADIVRTQRNVIGFALSAVVLGIGLALILTRSITRPLSHLATALGDGAQQTATAANQVSGSSQTLAAGASEQAASVEETAAAIEELSSMAGRNADHSQDAERIVGTAQASADQGSRHIDALQASMTEIQRASAEVTAIIKTIDEIAFQTNILALNASVEAARAGEAGAGFAVVADEVRALAKRSAEAARETASRIESSVAKGRHGTETSNLVAEHFSNIQRQILDLSSHITEIARASQEQNCGIDQLNTATSQIDQVTQTNAAAAEETAAAAEELNAQATVLQQAVETLCQLCGVAAPGTSQRRPERRIPSPVRRPASAPRRAGNAEPATTFFR